MAEEQTGQERTEQPTQRRKEEARRKGQVPRSRELNTLVTLVFAATGLLLLGPGMSRQFAALAASAMTFDGGMLRHAEWLPYHLMYMVLAAVTILAPFLAVTVVAALLGPLLMGGWAFSVQAMAFSFDKINPVKGLARIFSLKGLLELAKALIKFFLILSVTALLFAVFLPEMLEIGDMTTGAASASTVRLLLLALLILSATMALIAVLDVPFELWNHNRKLRMTRQEVRDEQKETDGRPEVKQRIRNLQRQISQRRMMQQVPSADVVITNPTHYAVALSYSQGSTGAPKLVAKGKDEVALRIRAVAQEHKVPVFEAPALARAVYVSTRLDSEIPQNLYLAVARILAYLFQLQRAGPTDYVPMPDSLEVPAEYDDMITGATVDGGE